LKKRARVSVSAKKGAAAAAEETEGEADRPGLLATEEAALPPLGAGGEATVFRGTLLSGA
jgi:hypothetical protein